MFGSEKINPSPVVYKVDESGAVDVDRLASELDDAVGRDPVDKLEIFELIRRLNDPEHPLTLEQLKVVTPSSVEVNDAQSLVTLHFTPTIPHCSMATLIGLCLRVKLSRSLPSRFKIDISVSPGSHATENEVNRQLNDKERVAAALENAALLDVVHQCIADTDEPRLLDLISLNHTSIENLIFNPS